MADKVIERSLLLGKVRDVLRANGRRCEIGAPPLPPPGEQAPKAPYTIVYGIDGGEFHGPPLDAPEGCATVIVQLTHVARNGLGCEQQADECRRVLLGRSGGGYTVGLGSGDQKVGGRRSMGLGGLDAEQPLAQLAERYEFLISL